MLLKSWRPCCCSSNWQHSKDLPTPCMVIRTQGAQIRAAIMRRYPFLASTGDRQAFLDFALKVLLFQPPALARAIPPQAPGRPQRAAGPSLDWLMSEPPGVAEVPSLFHWNVSAAIRALWCGIMYGRCAFFVITRSPPLKVLACVQTLTDMLRFVPDSPTVAAAGPGQARPGRGGLHQNGSAAQAPPRAPPPPGLSEVDVKLVLGKAQAPPDGEPSRLDPMCTFSKPGAW